MFSSGTKRSAVLALTVLILMSLSASSARADWIHKGAHLDLWCNDTSQLDYYFAEMADRGVNHVALAIWWWQDGINSTTVYPGTGYGVESANDTTVTTAIRKAHAKGIKVMIKLIVGSLDGNGCDQIPGSDTWFNGTNGFGDYVRHFAAIAQQENAEILCIGTELLATHSKEANWLSLISSVRSIYSGKLTYSQNADQNVYLLPQITWWDALDYAGIEVYYYAPDLRDPTWQQMRDKWTTWLANMKARRNLIAPNKKIIFTEGGCMSMDGAASGDAYSESAAIDEQEQADWYHGLLEAGWDGNEDWLLGAYFYDWQMANGFVDPKGWELQGKLAYDVLSSYYRSGPECTGDGRVNLKELAKLTYDWTGEIEPYVFTSIVPNAQFEEQSGGTPVYWTRSSTCSYVTSGGNPGAYTSIIGTTTDSTWMSDAFEISDNTLYTFAIDYKATGICTWADITLYDSSFGWQAKYELRDETLWGLPSLLVTGAWRYKSMTFTSPQHAAWAVITLHNWNTQGAQTCYDNIVLAEGEISGPAGNNVVFGENKLTNGGFETQGSSGSSSAEEWSFDVGGTIARTNELTHSGSWSAKMTCSGDWNSLWQPFKFVGYDFGGKSWKCSGFVRPQAQLTGSATFNLCINYYDILGARMPYTLYQSWTPVLTSADPATAWKEFNVTGAAPEGAAGVEVAFKAYQLAGTYVYVDDVSFTAPKTIRYGDFDKDSDIDFSDLAVFAANWLKYIPE